MYGQPNHSLQQAAPRKKSQVKQEESLWKGAFFSPAGGREVRGGAHQPGSVSQIGAHRQGPDRFRRGCSPCSSFSYELPLKLGWVWMLFTITLTAFRETGADAFWCLHSSRVPFSNREVLIPY